MTKNVLNEGLNEGSNNVNGQHGNENDSDITGKAAPDGAGDDGKDPAQPLESGTGGGVDGNAGLGTNMMAPTQMGQLQQPNQQQQQQQGQQPMGCQQQVFMNGGMVPPFGNPFAFNPQFAMFRAAQFGMMNPLFFGNPFFFNPAAMNNNGGGGVGGGKGTPEDAAKAQQQFMQQAMQMQANFLRHTMMMEPTSNGQLPLPGPGMNFPKMDSNEEILESLGAQCLERRQKKIPYFDASTLRDPVTPVPSRRNARGGVTEAFPTKLYRMLMDADKDGHADIVSFLAHGRAFSINKPEEFAKETMPKYFKQSRVSSFQRQLNLYGFTRINTGPDAGAYYHELFLRGRPALHSYIRRVGVPQTQPRRRGVKAHDATIDPDFYSITPISGVNNSKEEPKTDTKVEERKD